MLKQAVIVFTAINAHCDGSFTKACSFIWLLIMDVILKGYLYFVNSEMLCTKCSHNTGKKRKAENNIYWKVRSS